MKRIPKISIEPHEAPKIEVYRYFYNKLAGKVTVNGKVVPFLFSKEKNKTTYPCMYLQITGQKRYESSRFIGHTMNLLDTLSGNTYRVFIGEPFEPYCGVMTESEDRDTLYSIDQQIRNIMGYTGKVEEPFYIAHNRYPTLDHMGDNDLYRDNSENHLWMNRIGYSVYMRLPSGQIDTNYEPMPPVEEIVLEMDIDNRIIEVEVVTSETT